MEPNKEIDQKSASQTLNSNEPNIINQPEASQNNTNLPVSPVNSYQLNPNNMSSVVSEPKKSKKIILIFTLILGFILIAILLFVVINKSNSGVTSSSNDSSSVNNSKQNSVSDSEIKLNLSKIITELGIYSANNNGLIPQTTDELAAIFNDPSYELTDLINPLTNDKYVFVQSEPSKDNVQFKTGYKCNDSDIEPVSSTRVFILRSQLSDGSIYCISNN